MDHLEVNRANWDERAAVHATSAMYDLDGLVADPTRLSGVVEFDRRYLPDLAGRRVVHLQCHIGSDTISLARLGGNVTGYDLSPASLAIARDLAGRAGLDVTFVEGDVYEAPTKLPNGAFDVVYTGTGAINWLPDIARWAEVVATLLAPGGTLVIRDGHPLLQSLEYDRGDETLAIGFPYFETERPNVWDEEGTYTDAPEHQAWEHTVTHEWNHGIGEILSAVLDAGLVIRRFEELTELEWQPWGLWQYDPRTGRYTLPPHLRDRLPAMFALVTTKPPRPAGPY